MRLFADDFTLTDIERKLEETVNHQHIRILGDIFFSAEDYQLLSRTMREVLSKVTDIYGIEQYSLSLLTYWSFTIRYDNSNDLKESIESITRLPQHVIKHFLSICAVSFLDFDLNTFDTDLKDVPTLLQLICIHTGIPSDLHNTYFSILDSYSHDGVLEPEAYDKIMTFNNKMRDIYQHMNYDIVIDMINDTHRMLIFCKENRPTEEELSDKFPIMSGALLHACLEYCCLI